MKYGWLWAVAITGALMLVTGLFWMRFDLVIQSRGKAWTGGGLWTTGQGGSS